MLSTFHRRLPLLAAALLLLLAAGSARAECGDYLHIGSKKSAPTPKPCNGPHCSQRQLPPMPSPPAPPTSFSDEAGCVLSPPASWSAPRRGWIDIRDVRTPTSTPADILDPPR